MCVVLVVVGNMREEKRERKRAEAEVRLGSHD